MRGTKSDPRFRHQGGQLLFGWSWEELVKGVGDGEGVICAVKSIGRDGLFVSDDFFTGS